MRSFAVYNLKGGVGKTTVCANLGYLSAHDGFQTLLWDLDPQGALSYYFRIRAKIHGSGRQIVRGKVALRDVVKGTDFSGLDLIPADRSYRKLDLVVADARHGPTGTIQRLLEPLGKIYDHLFIDCPPAISTLAEGVLGACDVVLVPLIPTTLSVRSLEQILQFADDKSIPRDKFVPIFSMVDRRKTLHRQLVAQGVTRFQALPSSIPSSSVIERMGIKRHPVFCFAGRSRAASAFRQVWDDIQARYRPVHWRP